MAIKVKKNIISLNIDQEVIDHIKEIANQKGRSVSSHVNRILSNEWKKETNHEKERRSTIEM